LPVTEKGTIAVLPGITEGGEMEPIVIDDANTVMGAKLL
jgi:hypothetical protein